MVWASNTKTSLLENHSFLSSKEGTLTDRHQHHPGSGGGPGSRTRVVEVLGSRTRVVEVLGFRGEGGGGPGVQGSRGP